MARGFNYAPGASTEVAEAEVAGLGRDRLTELGGSRNHLVRAAVARREDCPFGLMVTLAHDYHTEVRAALASNPRLLGSVIDYLARDKQVAVLTAVCANAAIPVETLEQLAVHRKREVREAAAAALDRAADAGAVEDTHMPELRDRVFDDARERRTGVEVAPAPVQESPAPEPASARATRTAPVRGFRIPTAD